MKVYLIEKDNCEPYEDNYRWISNVFSSFRGASQYLIDEGFEVYYEMFNGKGYICFHWEQEDEYEITYEAAKIIEFEVNKKEE